MSTNNAYIGPPKSMNMTYIGLFGALGIHPSFKPGNVAYSILLLHIYGGFPKSWVPFWGAHRKATVLLGPILGSPYSAKLPYIYTHTYIHVCVHFACM